MNTQVTTVKQFDNRVLPYMMDKKSSSYEGNLIKLGGKK